MVANALHDENDVDPWRWMFAYPNFKRFSTMELFMQDLFPSINPQVANVEVFFISDSTPLFLHCLIEMLSNLNDPKWTIQKMRDAENLYQMRGSSPNTVIVYWNKRSLDAMNRTARLLITWLGYLNIRSFRPSVYFLRSCDDNSNKFYDAWKIA